MTRTIRTATILGTLVSLLWLSACSPAAPTSAPTPDLNIFRTEVASTVLAQVSQTLAAAPSDTPAPSPTLAASDTPAPSNTPAPGGEAAPGGATASAAATLPALPAGTATAGGRNLAQWVSQSIPDGAVLSPGESFIMTLRLRNAGNTTWTANYMLRFYANDPFSAPKEIPLGRIVLPGEEVDIAIPMKAPLTPGNQRSDWVMSDEYRANFKDPIFFKITVTNPTTLMPTRTTRPSATP